MGVVKDPVVTAPLEVETTITVQDVCAELSSLKSRHIRMLESLESVIEKERETSKNLEISEKQQRLQSEELAKVRDKLSIKEQETEVLEKHLEKLKISTESEGERIQSENEKLLIELKQLRELLNTEKERVKQLESNFTQVQKKLHDNQTLDSRNKGEYEELRKRMEKLSFDLQASEKAKAKALSDLKRLEIKSTSSVEKISALENALENSSMSLKEAKLYLRDANSMKGNLENKVEGLQAELKNEKAHSSSLEYQGEKLSEECNILKEENSLLKNQIEEMQDQLECIQQPNSRFGDFVEMKSKNLELSRQLETLKAVVKSKRNKKILPQTTTIALKKRTMYNR